MSLRASPEVAPSPSLTARVLTERLVLRPPRPSDVPVMRSVLRKNAAHLRPWSVAQEPGEDLTSLTSVSRAILRQRREWKTGQGYVFLVASRAEPTGVIGRVALGGVLRGAFQNAYLGYWIDVDHQGEGLMTEAVRAATTFAFASAGLHRVQAAVMPRNAASQRVLAKVGYRQEGYAARYLCIAGAWEDHVLFALTAEEWQAAPGG